MRRAALIVAVALLLRCACPGPRKPSRRRPSVRAAARSGNGQSVLLITIDTLRADHLGAYGYARATSPHLDALARARHALRAGVHLLAEDAAAASWP